MVERPASVHMHHGTTVKFRILALFAGFTVIPVGVYIAWLAFKILEPTPFNRAGLVILASVFAGTVIWFFLIAIRMGSFRKNLEDLQKYRVVHGIGVKPGHPRKKEPSHYRK